jgi:formylglycine-generating enzyme required for sulfatase activity
VSAPGPSRRRYPGAPPFGDDDLSRRLFFGRRREAQQLGELTTARRLVVVYAKSGMGKSSLINAGLKEILWSAGVLPLSVRVNDRAGGPFRTVYEGIEQAAKNLGVEHVAGPSVTLWHYFKTTEFWRGDVLLTPLLIVDQFEELFTLQSSERRAPFIDQLADLVRGVRTPRASDGDAPRLGPAPPNVKVMLALREDYLGQLEELSDLIPGILDTRFRLGPLLEEEARQAVRAPADLDDPRLQTKPFRYTPEALDGIWTFLSRRLSGQAVESRPYVEPFQLQLVCQRAEEIALEAQRAGGNVEPVTVTWDALGRDAGLRATLASFCERQIAALPSWRSRQAVRRLCEYGLINVDGRRLSLEEGEIARGYGVAGGALVTLVERRLFRADTRVGSVYYELSHDTLVDPILQARRRRERFVRRVRAGLVAAVLLGLGAPLATSLLAREWSRSAFARELGWVRILAPAGGQFMLGCAPTDGYCTPHEEPRHAVALTQEFEIMSREVTVAQYSRFFRDSRSTLVGRLLTRGDDVEPGQPKWSRPDHPMVKVSLFDSMAFCAFARGRLPTEVEWEYAARGGSADTIYPWGDTYSPDRANGQGVRGRDTWKNSAPVGSFPPNGYGLFDMIGNVWEWTTTVDRDYPYRRDDGREDPASPQARVVRGGSWDYGPLHLRLSFRDYDAPTDRYEFLGFRCVRAVSP